MIASEGWRPLVVVAVAAAAVTHFCGLLCAMPVWALCAVTLVLFYDPHRSPPRSPLAVLSPVDGRVLASAGSHDVWLDREALWIRVALRAPGISVLRSPAEGKVTEFWTRPSSGSAGSGLWRRINPVGSYAVWVQTDEGDDIVWVVQASRRFSRFRLDVSPGERLGQGQRSGFVYFARHIDVFLPPCSQGLVACGERTHAGCSVLANLVHR